MGRRLNYDIAGRTMDPLIASPGTISQVCGKAVKTLPCSTHARFTFCPDKRHTWVSIILRCPTTSTMRNPCHLLDKGHSHNTGNKTPYQQCDHVQKDAFVAAPSRVMPPRRAPALPLPFKGSESRARGTGRPRNWPRSRRARARGRNSCANKLHVSAVDPTKARQAAKASACAVSGDSQHGCHRPQRVR